MLLKSNKSLLLFKLNQHLKTISPNLSSLANSVKVKSQSNKIRHATRNAIFNRSQIANKNKKSHLVLNESSAYSKNEHRTVLHEPIAATKVNAYSNSLIFNKYEEEIAYRRKQANKSIIFSGLNLKKDYDKLVDDLHTLGTKIKDVFLFGDSPKQAQSYASKTTSSRINLLIEFETQSCVYNVIDNFTRYFSNADQVPASTRLLFYDSKEYKAHSKLHNQNETLKTLRNIYDYSSDSLHDSSMSSKDFFNPKLFQASKHLEFLKNKTCDEQIELLYDAYKIDELSTRLRFFAASIIEETLKGLFKDSICLPFGSSSNAFGQKFSDLDLAFSLDMSGLLSMRDLYLHEKGAENKNLIEAKKLAHGLCKFMSKRNRADERKIAQANLDFIEFIIASYLPRFQTIEIIKYARVPILKFDFEITQNIRMNCDLSMSTIDTSFQMSKLFWTYSRLDKRVAPLVFLIRQWAKLCRITTDVRPSINFTNFQLTVLVLNYLLRLNEPLVVSIDVLTSRNSTYNAHQDDEQMSKNIPKILLNNISVDKLRSKKMKTKNQTSLKSLLAGFFSYYSVYDFQSYSISLSEQMQLKPTEHLKSCVYIVNPFDPELNAAVNVKQAHLNQFINMCNLSHNFVDALKDKSNQNYDLVKFFDMVHKKSLKSNDVHVRENEKISDEMNL